MIANPPGLLGQRRRGGHLLPGGDSAARTVAADLLNPLRRGRSDAESKLPVGSWLWGKVPGWTNPCGCGFAGLAIGPAESGSQMLTTTRGNWPHRYLLVPGLTVTDTGRICSLLRYFATTSAMAVGGS
jgi:hypothetical protein